jgi:hypothetical protein
MATFSSERASKKRMHDRVMQFIRRSRSIVILRSDLTGLGSAAQLARVLTKLVESEKLVRVGHGLYAKTRWNRFTGRPAPAGTFEQIAAESFRKLGIHIGPGTQIVEYNAGLTTQVPMTGVVTTGRRRINRKIQVGRRIVAYEREVSRQRKETLR